MPDKKIYIIGALILIVLATAIYVTLPGKVKLRVDDDKTTFYVLNENNRWVVSGREYNSLWDFPSKMNRDLSTVKVWEEHPDPEIYIYRNTGYIRGPVIIDKYSFSGELDDVELVPIDHEITILNGKSYVYQYEVRDLEYSGETKTLTGTDMEFGKNMKVEWDPGYYWAKVYKSGILKVRYKIDSDNFVVHARLFDPTVLYLNGSSVNIDVEHGEQVNITATGDGVICLSGDHPDMGYNFTCGTGSVEFLWNASGGILDFNDSATFKNYTFTAPGCQDNSLNSIRNNSDVLRSLLDITGYNTTQFPKDIKLDIDADGTNDTVTSGELRGSQTYLFWFNDSSTSKEFHFNGSETQVVYVKLPQGMNVSGASLNMTPSTNNWQSHDSIYPRVIPTTEQRGMVARQRAPAANVNRMWFFGGVANTLTGDPCNKNYYWNIGSNTNYDGGADIPYNAGHEPLAVWAPIDKDNYEGFIVCGGYDECVADAFTKNCEFRRLNPSHPTRWVSLADMPNPMAYMGFVAGGDPYSDGLTYGDADTVYAFGGSNSTSDSNDNCWKYNVTADSWAACAAMPKARGDMWCEWINTTHVACYSGWFGDPANEAGGRYTEIYNTVGDSWTEVDMGAGYPEYGYGYVGYRLGGEIFRAGGTYSTAPKYDIYQMDAEFDDWIQITEDYVSGDGRITYGACDEYYGRAICESSGGGAGWMWHIFYVMPKEPFLQVGNYVNSSYTESIDMVDEVNISNFVEEVNYFINDCTEDSEGYCYLPLYFYNGAGGNITVHSLNITTSLDNLDLNWSTVTCASEYCNKTLRICSDQNGTVEISNINITYEGTKSINITAFNGTSSDTQWINVYHSKYERDLPYDWTDTIFFLPSSANESNVSAYGQTNSTPLINLTGLAQDKNFTVALQWNNTLSCVNLTFSNSSSKSNGFFVSNSSFTQIYSVERTGNCQMWAWVDLNNCNASATRYIQPTIEWKSCCDTCMSCGW